VPIDIGPIRFGGIGIPFHSRNGSESMLDETERKTAAPGKEINELRTATVRRGLVGHNASLVSKGRYI